MKRRDIAKFFAVSALASPWMPRGAFAQSQNHAQNHPQDHHHGHAGMASAPQGLITSSADCVQKGRLCLNHCFALMAAGDTSIVECARQVNELLAVCQALNVLAVANSRNLVTFAKAARTVCAACEAECRKHADKHAECKACAESCAACLKEIDKLA